MQFIKLILTIGLIQSSMFGMLIDKENITAPRKVGNIQLFHDVNKFKILDEEGQELETIKNYNIDKEFRGIDKKDLKEFLKVGRIIVNKKFNDEHTLEFSGRIKGGGPGFGLFVYKFTKGVCYTILGISAVGSAAAVVTSLGGSAMAVAGAKGVTGMAVKGAVAVAGKTASIGGLAISVGATSPTAVAVTTKAVLATGSATGWKLSFLIGGIESLALTLGLAAGMTPTV